MSNTQSIKQYLANIDYSWTNPASLVVFVPGLSLYTRTQQINTLIKSLRDKYSNVFDLQACKLCREYTKITTVNKAHLLGSLVQLVASVTAVQLAGLTAFSIPAIFALYEIVTCIRGLNREMISTADKKLIISP